MKKLIIPATLALLAVGMGERNADAGGFSFGISIGDSHRYVPAPVVVAPAQVISAPPVVVAQAPVVVAQPQVVVAEPPCAPGVVVVRELDRPGWYRGYRPPHGYYRPEYRHGHR